MSRLTGLRNGVTLIVALLLLWQLLYLWTGDVALASPMQTFRYTAQLLREDTFDAQVYETLSSPTKSRPMISACAKPSGCACSE